MPVTRTIMFARDISLPRVISSNRAGFALSTHRLGRSENQDGLLYLSGPRRIAAVADGLGGSADGGRARTIAIETIHERIMAGDSLPAAFWVANQRVRSASIGDEYIGSTLVAAEDLGREFEVVSCGDSRAYLIDRRLGLGLLTLDHSGQTNNYRQQWTMPAFPWFDSAHYYNYMQTEAHSNWLTSFIGSGQLTLSYYRGSVVPGQRLLLCSDGLFNFIPYPFLYNILLKFAGLKETVHELQEVAFSFMARPEDEHDFGDNYTAILIENRAAK